ncbi:phage holin family protein [Lacticigenium naphthae]|uniref:phage holin family protein n=1 Tax=Lacticigenium naphthae TaxID=515351 RepID=UPI000425A176|nr:phage holin family protein [Lacticigenium naphthae]
MKWWQRILINAILFLTLAGLYGGFYVESVWVAIGASIVLGILNLVVKPILFLLSLPITLITFGLFSIVINAIMLNLTAFFVGSGFAFASFGASLFVALSLSILNTFIQSMKE